LDHGRGQAVMARYLAVFSAAGHEAPPENVAPSAGRLAVFNAIPGVIVAVTSRAFCCGRRRASLLSPVRREADGRKVNTKLGTAAS